MDKSKSQDGDDAFQSKLAASIKHCDESITQRAPAMDAICREWYHAESRYVEERERRAFQEKRIKERLLYTLKIKKRYNSSSNWNHKWSSCMFGILQSRAKTLAERWQATPCVSFRVTEAVVQGMEDCELMVRYFEKCLASIVKNKSEHGDEGRKVARLLKKVFVRQRDHITFYEYEILKIESMELQELELDGKHCRELREQVAQDMQVIKRDWPDHGSSNTNINVHVSAKSGHDLASPSWHASWVGYHLHCCTWKLSELLSARIPLLCTACEEGDIKTMNKLLRRGVYVDGRDHDDITPLMHALRGAHVDACRVLLQHRASPEKQCSKTTPLLAAVESKSLDLVKLLLLHGADVNGRCWPDESRRGITPLIAAVQLGLPTITHFLLNEGADPNMIYCNHASDNHGVTALHVANADCAKAIRRIATRESNYNVDKARDRNGRVPMHWAIQREDWEAAAILNPQSSNTVDNKGNTLLHEFCLHLGSPSLGREAINVLSGAIQSSYRLIRKENDEGRSPLSLLAEEVAAAGDEEAAPDEEGKERVKYLNACKDMILNADVEQRVANEFYEPRIMCCFGTRPSLTEEEIEAAAERWAKRTEFEEQTKKELAEIFEKMVEEFKKKQQV